MKRIVGFKTNRKGSYPTSKEEFVLINTLCDNGRILAICERMVDESESAHEYRKRRIEQDNASKSSSDRLDYYALARATERKLKGDITTMDIRDIYVVKTIGDEDAEMRESYLGELKEFLNN